MIPLGRPQKKHRLKGQADLAIRDIYNHLQKVHLGPFRLFYEDSQSAIYLQWNDGNYYKSLVKFDQDGNIHLTGTVSASATLEDIGRD